MLSVVMRLEKKEVVGMKILWRERLILCVKSNQSPYVSVKIRPQLSLSISLP